jgi:lipopolysaccharide export system protein LptA
MKNLWIATLLSLVSLSAGASPLQGNKGPIEITSDVLEVLQNENVAIFTGKVVAVQGEMQLTADRMKVFYRDKADAAAKPANEGQQSISKIEVDGNVFMTTPTETARGLSGVYNAEKDELTLNGDVVLTKDKNVLKGAALVYDMGTGKSVLKNAGGNAVATGKPNRVRALFVPADKPSPEKNP